MDLNQVMPSGKTMAQELEDREPSTSAPISSQPLINLALNVIAALSIITGAALLIMSYSVEYGLAYISPGVGALIAGVVFFALSSIISLLRDIRDRL
tara:strand:+ start:3919 stop:4209 length:291 start_codon:yes stop_codon:yes gene_type:complete